MSSDGHNLEHKNILQFTYVGEKINKYQNHYQGKTVDSKPVAKDREVHGSGNTTLI